MFKLLFNVTFESLKMGLLQILMAVALALVGMAAYFYYNKKPKGMTMRLIKRLLASYYLLIIDVFNFYLLDKIILFIFH